MVHSSSVRRAGVPVVTLILPFGLVFGDSFYQRVGEPSLLLLGCSSSWDDNWLG